MSVLGMDQGRDGLLCAGVEVQRNLGIITRGHPGTLEGDGALS